MKKTNNEVLVNEYDTCPLWEASKQTAIGMLHECWFCKWSDFRKSEEYKSTGHCSHPMNMKTEGE